MKYTKYWFLLVVLFIACGDDEEPMTNTQDTPETAVVIPDGTEAYLNENSDYIFNQDSLYTYELIIPEANYEKINEDPSAEEYVEATLIFRGDTISPIGVRYKGSIGAYVGCLSGDDWANPNGRKTCTKLSMKVKINWGGREENFYKLKKLQFHSMNSDPSQFRDRLGYHLFQAMDIPTPRCVHARLIINGTYQGLFALVEQIDGRFAKYNFDDDEGNVYKEIWPHAFRGEPQLDQAYRNALKTNEEEQDVRIIKSFANQLENTNINTRRQVIEAFMDIPEIISYAVVDRMIRHDDGPFHWYCNDGECASHNFYWYEEPNNEKLHLIPWDLDGAFANIIQNSNPVTPIADEWGERRNNCNPFFFGVLFLQQWSADCDPLTEGWASYEQEYTDLKEGFKTGPFSKSIIDPLIDKWSAQILQATQDASDLHNDAVSIVEWENKKMELIEQIDYARDN